MGAQWFGMGKGMMKLKPFEDSIRKSSKSLETLGINVIDLIDGFDVNLNEGAKNFTDITEVFVMLVAIQARLQKYARCFFIYRNYNICMYFRLRLPTH